MGTKTEVFELTPVNEFGVGPRAGGQDPVMKRRFMCSLSKEMWNLTGDGGIGK